MIDTGEVLPSYTSSIVVGLFIYLICVCVYSFLRMLASFSILSIETDYQTTKFICREFICGQRYLLSVQIDLSAGDIFTCKYFQFQQTVYI